MEKTELERRLTEFNGRIDEAFRFSFPVRDPDLQQRAADDLAKYLETLEAEREKLRDQNDSYAANIFLGLCCYARSVIRLLHMWIAIRNDAPNEGWEALINAQTSACAAMRAHEMCSHHMRSYANHLDLLEHVIFPSQQFVSASFVLKSSKCSLCGSRFHECDHIAGFPYNGEFCSEIIDEVGAIDHVALVDHPYDKRCRTTSYSENGYNVDTFTLRRTKREDGDESNNKFEALIMKES